LHHFGTLSLLLLRYKVLWLASVSRNQMFLPSFTLTVRCIGDKSSALLSFDTLHFEKLMALSDEFWGASTLVCCLKTEPYACPAARHAATLCSSQQPLLDAGPRPCRPALALHNLQKILYLNGLLLHGNNVGPILWT
jgi:hypothetical protein